MGARFPTPGAATRPPPEHPPKQEPPRTAEVRLSLSGFDAGDGQDVLASALIRAGNRGRKNKENQDRA